MHLQESCNTSAKDQHDFSLVTKLLRRLLLKFMLVEAASLQQYSLTKGHNVSEHLNSSFKNWATSHHVFFCFPCNKSGAMNFFKHPSLNSQYSQYTFSYSALIPDRTHWVCSFSARAMFSEAVSISNSSIFLNLQNLPKNCNKAPTDAAFCRRMKNRTQIGSL